MLKKSLLAFIIIYSLNTQLVYSVEQRETINLNYFNAKTDLKVVNSTDRFDDPDDELAEWGRLYWTSIKITQGPTIGILQTGFNVDQRQRVADFLQPHMIACLKNLLEALPVYSGYGVLSTEDARESEKYPRLPKKWRGDKPWEWKALKAAFGDSVQSKALALDEKKGGVDWLIKHIHQYPHQVIIVTLGPRNDIGKAIQKDPSIAPLIRGFCRMC